MTLFDLICIFPRQMFLHLNDLLARYHFLAPLYILILCSHGFISPKSAKTLSSSQKRRRFKKVAAAFDSVFKSSTAAASQLERARSSQGSGKSARALVRFLSFERRDTAPTTVKNWEASWALAYAAASVFSSSQLVLWDFAENFNSRFCQPFWSDFLLNLVNRTKETLKSVTLFDISIVCQTDD